MEDEKKPKLNDLEKTAILGILKDSEAEDKSVRVMQMRLWKQIEQYYHGIQNIWYDDVAHDWRNINEPNFLGEEERDSYAPIYDYIENIIKPHGQSIIAALTQKVPTAEFFPSDADTPDDITSAASKSKLGEKIQRDNDGKLLMMSWFFKFFTQGLACVYNYSESDKKYGTYDKPIIKEKEIPVVYNMCSNCQSELGEADFATPIQSTTCPVCNTTNIPTQITKDETRTVQDGVKTLPKAIERIAVYGPVNVKIPYRIDKLDKNCGYLILYLEQHQDFLRDRFVNAEFGITRDDIKPSGDDSGERYNRNPSSYIVNTTVEEDAKYCTVKRFWLRTWMFEGISEESTRNSLKKKFPDDNLYVCVIGNKIVDAAFDKMEECWELNKCDLSTFIHSDPMARIILSTQDIKNTVLNLKVQTMEYGIPSWLVDSETLDFDKYSKTEAGPGLVFPMKLRPGDDARSKVIEFGRATLSREVEALDDKLDKSAQFEIGDFSSVYGGPAQGNTRTLGEYEQSRAMALQRLSIVWEYFKRGWANVTKNAVEEHIRNMSWDKELSVIKKNGGFENEVVLLEELKAGKTGNVYVEADEEFPLSIGQIRALLLEFIKLNSPLITKVITDPNNVEYIVKALGSPDIFIPGQDQKVKQLKEIGELAKTGPVSETESSVRPEPEVDDDEIHVQILRRFLVSNKGALLREVNPDGYLNCKLHLLEHLTSIEQKTMAQTGTTPPGVPAPTNATE